MRPGWLPADSRIAILGAEGWFGLNAQPLLDDGIPILRTASKASDSTLIWNEQVLSDFQPTVVLNFAFLTREREAIDGELEYRRVNELLTAQFLRTAELPSVRTALTISSGAAVSDTASTYGELKMREEKASLALASHQRTVVVGRAYSVSGPYVRRPHDYALSDFAIQAMQGEVSIRADRPTYRRYVGIQDFIEVCLRSALDGESRLIESGGELVEMYELAQRVVAIVNPQATIIRRRHTTDMPSTYASDNSLWSTACQALEFTPLGLEAQIQSVAAWLKGDDRYDSSGPD